MNWKIIPFLLQKNKNTSTLPANKKERPVRVPQAVNEQEPGEEKPSREHVRFIELEMRLRINFKGVEKVLIPFQPGRSQSPPKTIPVKSESAKDTPHNPPSRTTWGIIAAVGLALLGQLLFSQQTIIPGVVLYLTALIVFFIWGIRDKSTESFLEKARQRSAVKPRTEWVLLAIVLLFASTVRFYRITERPYGLEGDGVGAVVQSFFTHVLQEPGGDFGFHLESLPVSFFLQGLFMRIFGVSVLTSRYLSALLGSLSVLFFYGTVRRLAGVKTALAAAMFYASSFLMLNASRQTLIETQIEVWVLLSYWLTVEAVFTKKHWLYFLAGLTAMMGMFTYESFYMTPVVLGIFLLVDTWKHKKQWKSALLNLGLFIIPLLVTIPSTLHYFHLRQGYHFEAYNFTVNQNGPSLWSSLVFFGERFLFSLETLFVKVHWTDSLLNWMGPYINPLLMPLAVIGIIIAFWRPRNQYLWLFGAWFLLQYFLFGILGGTFPRVFFPSGPALFALAALGLMVTLNAVDRLMPAWTPIWRAVVRTALPVVFILIVAVMDLNIFWNVLFDPDERHKRRELMEFVTQSAENYDFTIFPYATYANEVPRQEFNLIQMTFYGVNQERDIPAAYEYVPYQELLSTFTNGTDEFPLPTALILDRSDPAFIEVQEQAWQAVQHCLPDSSLIEEGRFFNIYQVIVPDVPSCYNKQAYNLVSPEPGQTLSANVSPIFSWLSDYPESTLAQVWIDQKDPSVNWIEAEDFPRNETWHDMVEMATGFSGSSFITDDWQSQPISLSINLNYTDNYTLWVRSYRRQANDQVNFIQINSSQPIAFSELNEDQYNQWIWENLGTFALSEGSHTMTLSRTYGQDPQFSVFVDAIVLTNREEFNPETDSAWNEVKRSKTLYANNGAFQFDQPLAVGEYRWYLFLEEDTHLVDWQGNRGLLSEPVHFNVQD